MLTKLKRILWIFWWNWVHRVWWEWWVSEKLLDHLTSHGQVHNFYLKSLISQINRLVIRNKKKETKTMHQLSQSVPELSQSMPTEAARGFGAKLPEKSQKRTKRVSRNRPTCKTELWCRVLMENVLRAAHQKKLQGQQREQWAKLCGCVYYTCVQTVITM